MEIIQGDALEKLKEMKTESVDLVLTDMPYNITVCDWDKQPIDLDKLWEVLKFLGKDNTAYVFTASQPFTSKLVMSNLEWFKYEWIWEKNTTGFLNVKRMPMKNIENVLVFYQKQPTYNPQELKRLDKIIINHDSKARKEKTGKGITTHNGGRLKGDYLQEFCNYPRQSIKFSNDKGLHPTQKPIALMEYFIKTYTNEGDLVLDPFVGSGTTGVACKKLNRNFIGIELNSEYVKMAKERIKNTPEPFL